MLIEICHFINSFSVKLYFVLKKKYHLVIETIHCVIQEVLIYLLTACNNYSACFYINYRSSHRKCSVRKGVFKNSAKPTGKHLWLLYRTPQGVWN